MVNLRKPVSLRKPVHSEAVIMARFDDQPGTVVLHYLTRSVQL